MWTIVWESLPFSSLPSLPLPFPSLLFPPLLLPPSFLTMSYWVSHFWQTHDPSGNKGLYHYAPSSGFSPMGGILHMVPRAFVMSHETLPYFRWGNWVPTHILESVNHRLSTEPNICPISVLCSQQCALEVSACHQPLFVELHVYFQNHLYLVRLSWVLLAKNAPPVVGLRTTTHFTDLLEWSRGRVPWVWS